MEDNNKNTVKIMFIDNNNPNIYKKLEISKLNTFSNLIKTCSKLFSSIFFVK